MVIFLGLKLLKYQALGVISTQLLLVFLSFSLNHQLSVSIVFFIVIFLPQKVFLQIKS